VHINPFMLRTRRPTKKKPPLTPLQLKARSQRYAERYAKKASENAKRKRTERKTLKARVALRWVPSKREEKIWALINEYTKTLKSKEKVSAFKRRYRRIIEATPLWVDLSAIEQLEICRDVMNKLYPQESPWHIDHIVPLQNKLVCGLHWHANMHLLPAIANFSKGNRFCPLTFDPSVQIHYDF